MCQCTQCITTDSHQQRGFAAWPKGEPATPREAKAIYTAHVNFNWKDARKRDGVGPKGAAFYGVPAGMTAQQVSVVLNDTFREASE